MSKKGKRAIKIIAYVIAFVALYFYLGMVVTPKTRDDMGGEKYYSMLSINKEENQSLDMLFMGNSDTYAGVSPMEIYKETGIRSFVCGYAKQSLVAMRRQLEKLLKKQSPKVVFVETDAFFYPNSFLRGATISEFVSVAAIIKYHARWKEIKWRDFYTIPRAKADPFKGFVYSNEISNYQLKADFMTDVDAAPEKIEKSVLKDLKKIKRLCDKKGIKLVFICEPTATTWTWAKAKAVQNLADEFGVDNLDMNLIYDSPELGIDFSHDFRDNGNHLNIYGAKKVAGYLVDYINSTFDLEDYRGINEKWDNWLLEYEAHIAE